MSSLLHGLLNIPSPTGEEAAATHWLAGQMRALGYAVTLDAVGNVIGTLGHGPKNIVLLGHIDTVPGHIPVRQEGDLLYGRGAVDAKGPLACFVLAAAQAAQAGLPADRTLTVIGAVGEEGDSRGAKFLVPAYRPQALIIGEPSQWERVTLGYKGSAWFTYETQRPLAHTASQNPSACDVAMQFWQAWLARVAAFNAERPKMFDQLHTTLRGMASSNNGLTETARLHFGTRLPPGLSVAALTAWAQAEAGPDPVTCYEGCEAYRADKNTPLVRAFLSAIRQHGGQPSFVVKSGTSDMNLTAPVWACPTLAYGPGDSALDHTPHEHISLAEFERAVQVLAAALQHPQVVG